MNILLPLSLLIAAGLLMLAERFGVRTTLKLDAKGDVKRESRWFAQYGQTACVLVTALLIWDLDEARPRACVPLLVVMAATSSLALVLKRAFGRVRPGRANAGRFLGPTLRHDNSRESFPSSHSAAAVAFAVSLSLLYPNATFTFWGLAIFCAALRYVLDAHWPSDVLAGVAIGYVVAHLIFKAIGERYLMVVG